MAVWGSLINYWPYNLSLTLDNYDFANFDANGWDSYFNSLQMAAGAAIFGTALMFVGAWLNEKTKGFCAMRGIVQLLAFLPMAVPGLVLGLGYIFFFNAPSNPLNFLYATMAILVINTVAHFYTVGHLTATTALKQIDPRVRIGLGLAEGAGVAHLRARDGADLPAGDPRHRDLPVRQRHDDGVVGDLPLRAPTPSSPRWRRATSRRPATTAAAAALCVVIVITSAAVKALHVLADRFLLGRLQAWRRR